MAPIIIMTELNPSAALTQSWLAVPGCRHATDDSAPRTLGHIDDEGQLGVVVHEEAP